MSDKRVKPPSPWKPLHYRVFRALFIAQLASNIGTLMQSVGSAWVMGDLKAQPFLVALVQTASFLPILVLGIPSGALADIFDRRRVLIVAQAWMMASAGLLTALVALDLITPMSLLLLTFSLGVGVALGSPAWQAIQPELVPKEDFPQAIALGTLTYNVGRSIGPALGGLLLAAAGPGWVFAVNSLSFVGVIAVLVVWKRPRTIDESLPPESLSGAVRASVRYAANAPVLRGILVRTGALAVPAAAMQALLPVVARGSLGLGSGGYGLLLGCFGIGAASSAMTRPAMDRHLTPDQIVGASAVLMAAAMAVEALAPNVWAVGLAMLVGGAGWTATTNTCNVAAQLALPEWVRARGLSVFMLVLTGGIALGSALWGALAQRGVRGSLLVAASVLLLGQLTALRWRLLASHGLNPAAVPGDYPVVLMNPDHRDGPVLVTVSYRVPSEHTRDFAHRMRRVERHRRRTGAFQWFLYRDLEDPEVMLEVFTVESWGEHLRQHQRVTEDATATLRQMRELMVGRTTVHHFVSAYSPGALEPLSPAHLEDRRSSRAVPGVEAVELMDPIPAIDADPTVDTRDPNAII